MNKQVICINWGAKYGAPFINRLYASVARNITPPFTFTCFTDSRDGVRSEVLCEDLPPLDVEMPKTIRGIWPKARLWNKRLGSLEGTVLFLDLDLVITANIDDLFTYGDPDDVILATNPAKPFMKIGQTSVYRFPVGKLVPLLDEFKENPQLVADTYLFEQRFVSRKAPGGIKFFPRKWVRHFRAHCRRTFPLNYFIAPRFPQEAKIVIFPGGLHPEHAIQGQYGVDSDSRSPKEHLTALFSQNRKDPPFKHLRRFILPTPWVSDHWRE